MNNMKTLRNILLLLAFVSVFTACSEDVTTYQVDAELQSYVDSFYTEASSRGVTLPKNNLIVKLSPTVQAYTKVDAGDGQRAVYFNETAYGYLTDFMIESEMYKALAAALLNKNLYEYTPSGKAAQLDDLFLQ
jgi:hypothetical protein